MLLSYCIGKGRIGGPSVNSLCAIFKRSDEVITRFFHLCIFFNCFGNLQISENILRVSKLKRTFELHATDVLFDVIIYFSNILFRYNHKYLLFLTRTEGSDH